MNEFGFIFCSTANDETRVVLYPCIILSVNCSLSSDRVSNVHHLSQLTDFLLVVTLDIPSVVLMILLAIISKR